MTNEEAIGTIRYIKRWKDVPDNRFNEALDMAISALEMMEKLKNVTQDLWGKDMRPAAPEERQGIDDYIDSIAESMKDEPLNFRVGRENVEPEDVPDTNVGELKTIRQEIEDAKLITEPHLADYNCAFNDGPDITISIIDKHLNEDMCEKCEIGNPCLYCEHEFKAKEGENE